jgi:hypothetical protein
VARRSLCWLGLLRTCSSARLLRLGSAGGTAQPVLARPCAHLRFCAACFVQRGVKMLPLAALRNHSYARGLWLRAYCSARPLLLTVLYGQTCVLSATMRLLRRKDYGADCMLQSRMRVERLCACCGARPLRG